MNTLLILCVIGYLSVTAMATEEGESIGPLFSYFSRDPNSIWQVPITDKCTIFIFHCINNPFSSMYTIGTYINLLDGNPPFLCMLVREEATM